MKANETEAFIRAAAARSWSKRQTAIALGLNRGKFDLMVQALPDVQWASPGKTLLRQALFRSSPAMDEARARGRAAMRVKNLHTVGDRTGTIPELARLAGLTPSTVHRRLATMTLAEALDLPSRRSAPLQCKQGAGVAHGSQH